MAQLDGMSPRELQDQLLAAASAGILPRGLRGRTFVLTGKMSMPRAALVLLIRACGGDTATSVTYTPDKYLVTGDTGTHGLTQKLMVARSHGVPIISEDELVRMITGAAE